jgi:hypothetical protein
LISPVSPYCRTIWAAIRKDVLKSSEMDIFLRPPIPDRCLRSPSVVAAFCI